MKIEIEKMKKIIYNAKLSKHTHIKINPFEDEIFSGYESKNGWIWIGIDI